MSTPPLVSVRDLEKHYPITEGIMKREIGRVRAVDGISFDIARGETLGLVGESGCGKSTAATTLLRLEDPTGGQVFFDGEDITGYDDQELKRFRRRAGMIFQDPTSSFDPRMTVGESVAEPLVIHGLRDRERRRRIVEDLLERVGLESDDADRYPHEFSGGQKQRIAFARALAVNPEFIVADEPISALDVSVQAELLALMDDIQSTFGLSILFISHDMAIVREICDRVAVMYLGEIVEIGRTEEVFADPQHPYTRALLSSIPTPDPGSRGQGIELSGDVPDPADPPPGCRFHTRCPEIIPPADLDLEQEEWRRVMDLRIRLREEGIDIEAVRTFVGLEAESTAADPSEIEMKRAIRDEFGLPDRLSDTRAEDRLEEALELIVDEASGEATSLLAEAFPTICEEETITLRETAVGHQAACHRHDEQYASTVDVTAETGDD